MDPEYIEIEEGIIQCTSCGAHAASEELVAHYTTCDPEDTARWLNIVEESNTLDDECW